jgi:hypothetical protein
MILDSTSGCTCCTAPRGGETEPTHDALEKIPNTETIGLAMETNSRNKRLDPAMAKEGMGTGREWAPTQVGLLVRRWMLGLGRPPV